MILNTLATLGLLLCLPALLVSREELSQTTLKVAWYWAAATFVCLGGLWVTELLAVATDSLNQVWYLVSVLMLSPLMAVLGARKPSANVWTWFVVLPMVVVLSWPAMILWATGSQNGFQLETPPLIAFTLVTVMGTGNYFGTKFTSTLFFVALALVFFVAPLSAHVPAAFPEAHSARAWGILCLSVSSLIALPRLLSPPETADESQETQQSQRYQRLWFDFQNYFGIVWAKRVMDRMNQIGEREKWPAKLTLDGFTWIPKQEELDDTERHRVHTRIEHNFRWLLKRFVNPEWIDARLPGEETEPTEN